MPTFYENKKIPIITREGMTLSPAPHLHNHLEVVYLFEGQTYAVSDENQCEMHAGDVFIAFPNQVHCYPRLGDGKAQHLILIFSPFLCSEFKDLFRRMVPIAPVVKAKDLDPDLPWLARKVFEENHKETPYKQAATRGYLITFLSKLFCSMEFREEKQSDGIVLKSILNYCNQHYTEPLSLEILSKELSIGKYHISHIFSEKLKISFSDYVNGLRINSAIQQITSDPDRTLTDIAYDCGFGSTRTFNRAFIKFTGMTPRDYREENRYKNVTPINFYISE